MPFFRTLARLLPAAVALAAPHAVQALPDAPAGSFLHHQARSVAQLVQEVQTNPVARRRFARHFHIPEGQVADRFGHNLLAEALPRAGTYTVYFVAGSGLIYPTRMHLRPGTPVFVGRDGRPVLLVGTGDPLVPFAPMVVVHTIEGRPAPPIPPKEQVVPATGADIPITAAVPVPQGSSQPKAGR